MKYQKIYCSQNNFFDSIIILSKLIDIEPNCIEALQERGETYYTLAIINKESSHAKKAMADINCAITLDSRLLSKYQHHLSKLNNIINKFNQ